METNAKRLTRPSDVSAQLPTFLIVGAMKSGTTSLARHLAEHPDVYLPRRTKEIHFFDHHFDRGPEWYSSFFLDAAAQRAVGEATPNYMSDPVTIERMFALVPHAKLIAILRNPVDRAYSHYWHNRARGREPLGFEDALAAEPTRAPAARQGTLFDYVDRGRYILQLQNLCAVFPRESLLVTIFDDLRDDPAATFRSVCAFLEISEDFVPTSLGGKFGSSNLEVRSQTVKRLAKRLPAWARRGAWKLNTRRIPQRAMDASTRRRLLDEFRPDNALLEAWLGRDLSGWGR